MKKLHYRLISLCLSIALFFTFSTNAFAAPTRNSGKVKYLSEVALIEADDLAAANAVLAELKKEENGGFEGVLDLNLNEGGAGIYLAYKSSANVDDAITDLSVMHMGGDYLIGSYEQLYNQTLDSYVAIVKDYRIIAAEFKKNYDAGTRNALVAYRQMNYYYVEKEDGTKIYMGDYMLNFPAEDEEFAKMLFGGNMRIITNIRSLLAMGITGKGDALADRIEQAYARHEKDPTSFNKAEYEPSAKVLLATFTDLKKALNNLPDEIAEIEKSTQSEEEREAFAALKQEELNRATAFYNLLCEISIGDSNLGEMLLTTPILEVQRFFPVVAAATPAEALLMTYDSIYEMLLYTQLSMAAEEMDAAFLELEKDFTPVSVYFGVQNDLIEGSIGVTGEADTVANTTGQSYVNTYSKWEMIGDVALTGLGFTAGFLSALGGVAYIAAKEASNAAANLAALKASFASKTATAEFHRGYINDCIRWQADAISKGNDTLANQLSGTLNSHLDSFNKTQAELDKIAQGISAGGNGTLTGWQSFVGGLLIVAGVATMVVSVLNIINLVNKYCPEYTEIPDNMVHAVSSELHGDRFVNYNNAKSYALVDGQLKARENDLNAYGGKMWVSLYYTKNYEAGKCLTTTADLIAEETPRSGYSAVHHFGRTSNYNLNSHCNRTGAKAVYLAFKYSNNEKSAVTEVPDLIGSIFSVGACTISGLAGMGLGVGLMAFLQRKKKSKEEK